MSINKQNKQYTCNKEKNEENGEEIYGAVSENPFVRRSVIMRSPPFAVVKNPLVDSGSVHTSIVNKLGEKISKLVDFLKTRSNVHKDIVSISREIKVLYMQISEGLNSSTGEVDKQILMSKETQTDDILRPSLAQLATPKRKRDPATLSPKENKSKKKKTTTPKKTVQNIIEPNATNVPTVGSAEEKAPNPDWITVRPRDRRRKKPIRPDALVIKTSGDMSYADILRQVKNDPKMDALGQNVKSIRKTEKGELLLELNKPAHQYTGEFKTTIEEVLGTAAEVRALTQEVLIEIKDMDEVTTKEDVYNAIISKFDEFKLLQPSAIRSMRKTYGGTQTATIGLSASLASRLIEAGKIRIGWVICRIREKIIPRRCYKCLDYGHTAAKCKSLNDYSGSCLRCGEDGHKIRTCTKNPKCLLCVESTAKSDHVTGSVVCPYYVKALRELKSRI